MTSRDISDRNNKPDYAGALAEIEKSAVEAPINADDCRLDINEAVESYIFYRDLKREEASNGSIKGAPRAMRLKKSADNIKQLITECDHLLKSARYIDPLVWALESDSDRQDWEEASNHIAVLQSTLKPYAAWFKKASEIAQGSIPGRGNRGSRERDFVRYLILLFKDYTGKALPRYASRNAHATDGELYSGPIVRFVKAVAQCHSNLDSAGTRWGAMVDECLKDLHKYPDTEEAIILRASRRQRLMLRYGTSGIGK
jgi:hypothetical protein